MLQKGKARHTTLILNIVCSSQGIVQVTQSLSSIVSESLSTSLGDVSSRCRAAPTTAPSTTVAATTTRRRQSLATTSDAVSSAISAEVTSETSSLLVIDPATLVPVSGDSSLTQGRSTITSFRTVVITMTDANGRETVLTSASASLNTVSGNGGGSSHTGASKSRDLLTSRSPLKSSLWHCTVAGGIAGGIAAIILALVVFLLLRRRGYFRREDEHFNDDIWMPPNHMADDNFGGAGAGAVGSSSLEEKDADPAGPEMAQRSPSRASWLSGERAPSMYLDTYGSQYGVANSAGLQRDLSMHHGQDAVESTHAQVTSASLGYAASRRLSHSLSHDETHSRQPTLPRLPPSNSRLSHEYYQQMRLPQQQHLSQHSYPMQQHQQLHRELDSTGPTVSDHTEFSRTAATSGSDEDHSRDFSNHYRLPSSGGSSIASRRMSSHMRPPLAVLTTLDPANSAGGSGYSSSALESSSSHVPALSAKSSGSTSSAPSSALPTPLNPPVHSEHGLLSKAPRAGDELFLKPIPRPGMERAYSSDSCMAPSQFLGARIVNADERERDEIASIAANHE